MCKTSKLLTTLRKILIIITPPPTHIQFVGVSLGWQSEIYSICWNITRVVELIVQEYIQFGGTTVPLVQLIIHPSLSQQRDFDSFAKKGHFISKVRCSMIGYSQVHLRVQHSDGRTTFTIKTLIYFGYLCHYNLILILCTYFGYLSRSYSHREVSSTLGTTTTTSNILTRPNSVESWPICIHMQEVVSAICTQPLKILGSFRHVKCDQMQKRKEKKKKSYEVQDH